MKKFTFILALTLLFVCAGCKPCPCQEISRKLVTVADASITIKTINENNFDDEVLKANGFVLVDFSAVWCPACKAIAPIFEELALELQGKVSFFRVDVNESPKLAQKCGIQYIPMLILIKDGKPLAASVGMKSKAELLTWLNQYLTAR
jgi:thioredoxin 1